jgi:hypothetical protein
MIRPIGAGHTIQLQEDWYRSPNSIKVAVSTIWSAPVLVLLMGANIAGVDSDATDSGIKRFLGEIHI